MGRYGTKGKVRVRPPPAAPAPSTGMVRRAEVTELVLLYQAEEARVREAFEAIATAKRNLTQLFGMGSPTFTFDIEPKKKGAHIDMDNVDGAIGKMRSQAWRRLVLHLELQKVMSQGDVEKLDRMLEDGPWPEISEASVRAMAEQYGDFEKNLRKAVTEVFDWLRPRARTRGTAGEYKTNDLVEIGPKVVITGALRASGRAVCHTATAALQTLERVFLILDGKGMRSRTYYSDLQNAIERTRVGETEYFSFRACANDNLHLVFRRLDLLRQVNALAGGARLRPVEAP